MAHYLVNANGKEFDIVIEKSGDSYRAVVNGREQTVESSSTGKSKSVMLVDGNSHEISINSNGYDNSRLVTVGGIEIELEIDNFRLAQLKKAAGNGTGKAALKKIKAPMPGLILEVKVNSGEKVESGQLILVIEAMKMENAIKSSAAAVVKNVAVSKGQSVEKGDLLIEFE